MDYAVASKVFENLAGGTFVGIDTLTTVSLKGGKKNPMQGRVTKLMYDAQVMCFSNTKSNAYENMVNRRLAAEGKGSFEVGPRAWGERIPGTCFVAHKSAYYLEVIFMRSGKVSYFLDGAEISKYDIEGLEFDTEEGRQARLENKVVLRTFALNSILALRANGKEYK